MLKGGLGQPFREVWCRRHSRDGPLRLVSPDGLRGVESGAWKAADVEGSSRAGFSHMVLERHSGLGGRVQEKMTVPPPPTRLDRREGTRCPPQTFSTRSEGRPPDAASRSSSSGGVGVAGASPPVLALSLAELMACCDCFCISWDHSRLQQTWISVLTSLSYHLKCSFNGGRRVKVAILDLALE